MSRTTTLIKTIFIVAALLFLVVPVMAGGWAVVTVDELPKDVHAGTNIHLEFMVRQHGEKPIHTIDFMNGEPLTPFLLARHVDTGQTVRVEAQPAEGVGRFTVDVVFPLDGTWQWEITPHPLEGTSQLEPLNVLASSASLAASERPSEAGAAPWLAGVGRTSLRWSALALLLVAAVTALLGARQRRPGKPGLAGSD